MGKGEILAQKSQSLLIQAIKDFISQDQYYSSYN
jgi:hypothetical protein